MRMTTPDHTKWMVAICSKVFRKDQISRSELLELSDPSTGEQRPYVLVENGPSKLIVETQSLEAEFSSFFVGRHVVKDGHLYVLNPVDPLFFVLANLDGTQKKSTSSWQPFDQSIEGLVDNKIVRRCVTEAQLGHLCNCLCNDQTDNVSYFKFSQDKSLKWLQKKQERVLQVLLQQEKKQKTRREKLLERCPKSCQKPISGSTSSTFYNPEDEDMVAKPIQATNSNNEISSSKMSQLKLESIQIVCNYLSDDWTAKFLEYLNVTEEEVFPLVKTTTSPAHTSSNVTADRNFTDVSNMTTPAKVTPKVKTPVPSRSMGNKSLEKVNKRGMSSMTSFFAPKKKQAISKS